MRRNGRCMLLSLCLALAMAGCNDSEGDRDVEDSDFPSEPTVQPGDTLVVGQTETIAITGVYLLPAGATFLTTRCIGDIAVTIEAVPGSPVINTCSGDGTSSQTNMVAGVSMVFYDVADGGFARVTVT